MIAESEALDRILAAVEPLPAESATPASAVGRFAAAAISSPAALPRFDQSAMDGYALRAADTPGRLRVVGEQPAGIARGLRVGAGEAVRIFTGAPLPAGADAVAMQEDVTLRDGEAHVAEALAAGSFVRRRGEEICAGQQLVAPGMPITAARAGLLCAAGIASLPVHRRPRIAILATGDELRPLGAELAPGELYDSNSAMLAAMLAPFADVRGVGRASDDPGEVADAMRGCADADAIVLSAGVSVGDRDPVHEALRKLGARVELWRVAVKPGKPFLFARLGSRQHVFGLPGNPVSAFVTAHLFVIPALRRMAGAADPLPVRMPVPLGAPAENPGDRVLYMRAAFRGGLAFPAPPQHAQGLASLAASDLLLRLDKGESRSAGQIATALPLHFELTQVLKRN